MNQKKNLIFIILYFLLLVVVLKINSDIVTDWLNRSLFNDFTIDTENTKIKESFHNGTSFVFLISLFIYALIGSLLASLIVINTIWAVFIFANHLKVQERNEFITFKELYTVTSPKELISLINLPLSTVLTITTSILLLTFILYYISKKISYKFEFKIPLKTRLAILLIAFIPLTYIIFIDPNTYNQAILKFHDEKIHNWNPIKRAQANGFIPIFINTIKPNYMDKPDNYNKMKMKEIEERYFQVAERINADRKKSINDSITIYYLSETFINPTKVPNLLENETPIPFVQKIMNKHISGSIYSQYIGGGTANIEWTVLTSFSLEVFNEPKAVTPYSDFYADSNNHHTVLSFFDKKKVAIHPYTAHLYKRKTVYPKIGFDDFLYLDNGIQHTEKLGTHIRISDAALHKDVLRVAQSQNIGFIHVVSMQNHSPYTKEIPDMEYIPKINSELYPEKKQKEMINYLQGLRASDMAIEELISELDKFDIDVNLLLYGDHFPSLFRGLENQFTEEQIHHTPWFIYMSNGKSLEGSKYENISPIFLTTILLKEGNYYVSPFQALIDCLLDAGVKRIGKNYIITEEGMIEDKDIETELFKMITDYRLIMYDALFGSNWLSNEFYMKQK